MSIMVIVATISGPPQPENDASLDPNDLGATDTGGTGGRTAVGDIPDRFAAMTAPQAFEDAPAYRYQVWIDDVRIGGETLDDLRRAKVCVFRTGEGLDKAVTLVTIVRLDT